MVEKKNASPSETYKHMSNKKLSRIKSPLDSLKIKRGDVKNE